MPYGCPFMGYWNAFTVVSLWAIEFVIANGCATYYDVKYMNFENENKHVYESISD